MKGIRRKTLNRCVCPHPQKNERQQKKPVTHGIRNMQYRNTNICRKKLHQKMLAVSRI